MNTLLACALIALAFGFGVVTGAALAFKYISRVTDEELRQVLE